MLPKSYNHFTTHKHSLNYLIPVDVCVLFSEMIIYVIVQNYGVRIKIEMTFIFKLHRRPIQLVVLVPIGLSLLL